MYVYLSKILPLFVMPLGVTLFLCLLAFFLVRRGKKHTASGVILVAFLFLWVMSTPVVSRSLYGSVESAYPARPVSSYSDHGCAVILGGIMEGAVRPRVDVELHDSVDRVFKTAELHLAGKAPWVVVTGGNQPWSRQGKAEAELIRDLLVRLGVPQDHVVLEGSSRNTRENALYTKNAMDSIHCDSALLVTSAAHMPRALAAFRAANVSVTPVSTDVRVAGSNRTTIMDFLPDARALMMSQEAIREMVGQWVYKLQGWG